MLLYSRTITVCYVQYIIIMKNIVIFTLIRQITFTVLQCIPYCDNYKCFVVFMCINKNYLTWVYVLNFTRKVL